MHLEHTIYNCSSCL